MAGVLLAACLEAYQAQAHAMPEDAEFPTLAWEGWKEIAEKLGILGTVDSPIFRQAAAFRSPALAEPAVRQAVKIAVSADAASLKGDHVKFGAVEERLCDILSGGASLSQVPDTQAEELMLRPAKARIVLRERRRRPGRHNSVSRYEVLFHSHPHEEGTWLTQGELRRHFPDTWTEMIRDYNERKSSGRLLEPSPSDDEGEGARAAGGAGEAEAGSGAEARSDVRHPAGQQQAEGQQQRAAQQEEEGGAAAAPQHPRGQPPPHQPQEGEQARRQAPQASAGGASVLRAAVQGRGSGVSSAARRLSAAGGRLPPAQMPVAPRNIPLESQPEQEQPLHGGQGQPLPPSVLLAGVRMQPVEHQAAAAQPSTFYVLPLLPLQAASPLQPAYGSGYRAEQGEEARRFFVQPPAQAAAPAPAPAHHNARVVPHWGPPAAPAAAAGTGASGPAAQADSLLARFFQPTAQQAGAPPAYAPPLMRSVPAPQPPPGYASGAAPQAPAPIPPPGYRATAGGYAGASPLQPPQPSPARVALSPVYGSRPAAVASLLGGGGAPLAAPRPPAGYRSPGGAAPAVAPSPGGPSRVVSGQALYQALRRKRPAAAAAEGPPAAGPLPPPVAGAVQAGEQAAAAVGGGMDEQQQPAPKRQRRAAGAPPPGLAAVAAAAEAAADSAVAAAINTVAGVAAAAQQQQGEPGGLPGSGQQRLPTLAPEQAAAADASTDQGPPDEAELAFQQGLPIIASMFQNKAPSPCKLDRQGPLLPPGDQQAPQAADAAAAGEDDFFDAQEELQPEGSPRQAGAAAAPAAQAPAPLHQLLRTQADEVQWTNRYDEEGGDGADSLPDTQASSRRAAGSRSLAPALGACGSLVPNALVVQGGSGEEGGEVVPDTEEEQQVVQAQPAPAAQRGQDEAAPQPDQAQQQQQAIQRQDAEPAAAAAGRGVAEVVDLAEEEEGEEEEEDDDPDSDHNLALRIKEGTIRGAKTTEEGVELWLQWADGERAVVPAARLHSLAQADCPGCWSLQKLIQFYESKTRGGSRAKKARGGR
ncbi:hypothetical protein CHLNCDRAFT_133132 [Chlorella variabilis]|uniref:Chromo domain-containing protein n=1 Tax=Chlorella variabilis TaxID=554065 RepID=E1Z2F4_CHLVA|nr:hypothetical protein CHLNCDRAFT_133132 [Chlorella variabilis]EFN59651.1 hypothetical protein CHLNCDRAFT_133132 [Chlorella variabilis]|eukprot:XP_005851753.1 hypothetical protein CHLNCDRAFT_133132 [Chlorella variabilis]